MPLSIDDELDDLRARSLLRRLREIESPVGPAMEFAGRKLINFSSNDYLGIAAEPVVREAAKAAIDQYGIGAGASRLICGTLSPHVRLEERLAEFKRTEASLTFTSGYAAAAGTLGALLHKEDVVILDKLCHACLIDGARTTGATLRIYPHNHLGRLESHLQWAREHYPEGRIIVATESVFSMDGDWALLPEIVALKNKYGALLLVDEAHAVGVIGDHGRGLADQLGLTAQIDIHMGTLSKALGTSGGYIAGSRRLIDLLVNRARTFIYTTAQPPAIAAASIAAVEFMMSPRGETRRQLLRRNLAIFAEEMAHLFRDGRKVQSAIIPIMLGAPETAIAAAQTLAEKGYFVPAIRYPTVPPGSARLRVTISAKHTPKQIAGVCEILRTFQTVDAAQSDEE
jgi:8-amino-7-oxononanoate synthase